MERCAAAFAVRRRAFIQIDAGEDFRSAGLRTAADSQVADPFRERPRVYLNRKILLSASIKERTGVHESVELEYRSPL